jgi:hypothetical protein
MRYFKIPKISDNKPIEFCWESLCHFLIFWIVIICLYVFIVIAEGMILGANPVQYALCKFSNKSTITIAKFDVWRANRVREDYCSYLTKGN